MDFLVKLLCLPKKVERRDRDLNPDILSETCFRDRQAHRIAHSRHEGVFGFPRSKRLELNLKKYAN